MNENIMIRIILDNPLPGYKFSMQSNAYANSKLIQIQVSSGETLQFEFKIKVIKAGYLFDFSGNLVHGHKYNRFFYIKLGSDAGEVDFNRSRRIKIPFVNIEEAIISAALCNSKTVFVALINGRGKDKTPASETEKPINGWHVEYNN